MSLPCYGEDGYPYAIPVNFLYEDGKIYFHGAKQGHKIDAIHKDNRVCFTLYDEGYLIDNKMGLNVKSVVIFGHIREVEDHDKVMEMTRKIGDKYDPREYVAKEVKRTEKVVNVLELTIDHMTGKLINKS